MNHITIPDTAPARQYAVGAEAQQTFPLPFPFASQDDIRVSINDVGTNAFSVFGVRAEGGFPLGTVTLTAAVANATVAVWRDTSPSRASDFPYPSRTLDIQGVNTEFDRQTLIDQEHRATLGRTLRARPGAPPLEHLPDLGGAANRLLGFGPTGAPALYPISIRTGTDGIDVTGLGARGDGVADDTRAAQQALDFAQQRGGGTVFFPTGTYRLSEPLRVGSNVMVRGANQRAALLVSTALDQPILRFDGPNGRLRDLSMIYDGQPRPGATAIVSRSANAQFSDFIIFNCHTGIKCPDNVGAGQHHGRFFIFNYEWSAIEIIDCFECMFDQFTLSAGNVSRGLGGGVRLTDGAEANYFSNGSILSGRHSLVTGAASFETGRRPAYGAFTAVYFDAASNGSFIEDMVETEFLGCWFSGGRESNVDGMRIGSSDSVRFIGCRFFNCGYNGALVIPTAKRIVFDACKFGDNSVTAGPAMGRGLEVQAGTTDFIVTGCTASNGLYGGGQQGYGILVGVGASDRYVVADNLVSGNRTGGVFDGGTGSQKRVAGNF